MQLRAIIFLVLIAMTLAPVSLSAQPQFAGPCGDLGQVAACRHYGSSETRLLQFESIAFLTNEDASAFAEGENLVRSQYWDTIEIDVRFGDRQFVYVSSVNRTDDLDPVQVFFVSQNTVNTWLLSDGDDALEVLIEIYNSMPNLAPVGSTPAEQSISMVPTDEIVAPFGFYEGREKLPDPSAQPQTLPTEPVAVAVTPRPTTPPKPKPTATTSASDSPSSIDARTVEIMNNQERYHNSRVTIRGEVYIIDKVNDQTALVITDEDTYFFNVVYDGDLPGIRPGDTVVVTGILIDRTVQGSPIVDATSVRRD